MTRRSLYQCLNAQCRGKEILCAEGRRLGAQGYPGIPIVNLAHGEPLEPTVCQSCLEFDEMGPPIPSHQRGWETPAFVNRQDDSMLVADLDLSTRLHNVFRRASIYTVSELLTRSEHDLLQLRNFGVTCLEDLTTALGEVGIDYGNK